MQLFWGNAQVSSRTELIGKIPSDVLASPRRSVIPLVDFVGASGAFTRLAAATGVDLGAATEIIFEFAVPVQKGAGKPSYTDLVVLTPDTVWAIEAKYTEPEYETVAKWLGLAPSQNRIDVLDGWLALLSSVVKRRIVQTEVHQIPYQLVHRAASACFPARQKRAMTYLVFGDRASEHYSKHVGALQAILPPGSLSLAVASCPIYPSAACVELQKAWGNGDRSLASQVREALLNGPLYTFGQPRLEYGAGIPAISAS